MNNHPYKIIKLTTPWKSKFLYNTIENPSMYLAQTPNGQGVYGDFKFEINNKINECDYWFIYGGLTLGDFKEKVKCDQENIFYITDETHCNRYYLQNFLNQFPTVITPRTDLNHKNIISYHETLIWYLNKSYDDIINTINIEKTKNLCIINSNLIETPLQRIRYELTHKLIGHFKDKIHVYGRGHKTFKDKWEIIKDYKYCIAIENTVQPGYFTEKISECFLTHTYPIYFGCPNITDYYNRDAFSVINIYDYKKCILEIERILDDDPYERSLSSIMEQKSIYLEKYHLFPSILNIVNLHGKQSRKKTMNTIYKEDYFRRMYWLRRFVQIINNRNIPDKYKFNIDFYVDGDYANKNHTN